MLRIGSSHNKESPRTEQNRTSEFAGHSRKWQSSNSIHTCKLLRKPKTGVDENVLLHDQNTEYLSTFSSMAMLAPGMPHCRRRDGIRVDPEISFLRHLDLFFPVNTIRLFSLLWPLPSNSTSTYAPHCALPLTIG